jgi:hypothetical protein
VREEISRDLKRTHTSQRMKTAEGQEELKRVLQGIAYALPDVGYCQGMNFIASTIISALNNDEELAFWIFMNLLVTTDMKSLYLPVSTNFLSRIFTGSPRASSKELSNGTINQVPHAEALFPPSIYLNVHRLLHLEVDNDCIRLLPAL